MPTYTPTYTATPTATAAAILVGHVVWQGPPTPPSTRQQLPLTLTLKLGTTTEASYNDLRTDSSGFFTVPVTTLANGTYSWRVKGTRYLASSGTIAGSVRIRITHWVKGNSSFILIRNRTKENR